MDEGRPQGSRSLTGVWQGIYSYLAGGMPTVAFTATLIEAGGMLNGSVHEACMRNGDTVLFSVNGSRHGAAVSFVKTYQGTDRRYGTIVYDGSVNGDATEIEGRWTIPGDWSGRFLMTRSGDQPHAAVANAGAQSSAETVELTPTR
jgi:hypothetical protein